MFGKLYIVATPIGNLSDFTFRGLDTLKTVDTILAEDTRITRKLLSRYDIDTHTLSYHSHSSENKKNEILKMLIEGKNLALVTDAGTPGISDPGNELIDWMLDKEPVIKVIPISGASSLTTALSISGFRTNKFMFLGFLPKKGLQNVFVDVKDMKVTFAFFESPRRVKKTLAKLEDVCGGDIRVFVGRELTKLYEETFRGKLSFVREKIEKSDPRGEIVVIVEN